MTELLERAIETARSLPVERQDEIACVLLSLAESSLEDGLTSEDEEAVLHSRAAMDRRELASDRQMAAIRAKHGV